MQLRYAWILFAVSAAWPAAAQTTEPNVFEWGIEQRTRGEFSTNAYDLNDKLPDDRSHIRYRTRAWAGVPLGSNVDAFVGVMHEMYQKFEPRQPWRLDEFAFESAYINVRRVFADGLSLRVGRQEFNKGDGFLFSEGTPGDGSRTTYYNAVNLGYTRGASKIELLGILNPSTDRYLPRIHDGHKRLAEWDERALGAYFTSHALRNTDIETYYFYKRETGDYRAPTHPQFQPDRYVHTAGGRLVHRWGTAWTAAGELALQRGRQHDGADIAGWGGYSYLKRTFTSAAWKPYLQGGYWAFSGDDPDTPGRVEGFDPLFSRFPRWGLLYIYSLQNEKGSSYWSNIGMWQAEAGVAPHPRLKYRFTVYGMSAFHPFRGDPRIFAEGTGRGTYLQSRLDFTLSEHWKGHALWEYLAPGSFYSQRTHGRFVRLELIYTWSGKTEPSHS